MKQLRFMCLLLLWSPVCWGQLTTAAPHTGNDWPIRLTNTLKGQWSNPWTPIRLDNHTNNPITIWGILTPQHVTITQNNCTNLGSLTILPGQGCLLYVSYFAVRTGHIALGPIYVIGPGSSVPLEVLVTGYGCPVTWTNYQCGTFNAGW